MDSVDRQNLKKIAEKSSQFFGHAAVNFVDIQALLHTLLTFEEARLVEKGLSQDEAHQLIQDVLSKHQNRLAQDAVNRPLKAENSGSSE